MVDKILTDRVKELFRESTTDYVPNSYTARPNTIKTGLGIAGLTVLYFVPGPQPLLSLAVGTYTGIKGYQTIRDYIS